MKSHGFQVGGERGHVGVSSTSAIWELASGLRSSGPGRWEETVPERVSYLPSVTRRFGSLGTTTVAPCFPTPCSVPTCIHGDSEGAAHGLPLQGPAHFSYVLTFPWGFLAQRDASPCPPPPIRTLSLAPWTGPPSSHPRAFSLAVASTCNAALRSLRGWCRCPSSQSLSRLAQAAPPIPRLPPPCAPRRGFVQRPSLLETLACLLCELSLFLLAPDPREQNHLSVLLVAVPPGDGARTRECLNGCCLLLSERWTRVATPLLLEKNQGAQWLRPGR